MSSWRPGTPPPVAHPSSSPSSSAPSSAGRRPHRARSSHRTSPATSWRHCPTPRCSACGSTPTSSRRSPAGRTRTPSPSSRPASSTASSTAPPGGLRFRHPLLRKALLDRLGPARLPVAHAHARAAQALESLGRSPARVGRHLVEAKDPVAAVPHLLRAAETQAALGAYTDALATVSTAREHATGEHLARLLALRADLLLAKGDRSARDAFRAALAVVTDGPTRAHLRVGLARTATFAADYETARIALEGLEPDGGPSDAELMLAQGLLAYLTGDLATADSVVAEARRRLAFGGGGAAVMFELVALQGLLAHHRGEWFQQLDSELHKAAEDPGASI